MQSISRTQLLALQQQAHALYIVYRPRRMCSISNVKIILSRLLDSSDPVPNDPPIDYRGAFALHFHCANHNVTNRTATTGDRLLLSLSPTLQKYVERERERAQLVHKEKKKKERLARGLLCILGRHHLHRRPWL